jgi:hypothetical protein
MAFENTKQAAPVWRKKFKEYINKMDSVECNQDVFDAEEFLKSAKIELQTAYYEDTKQINCLNNCLLVHPTDLIRIAETN